MLNYQEILKLHSYSQLREIEASAPCSCHTISDVLTAAKEANIHWPLDSVTNEILKPYSIRINPRFH